MDTSGSQKHRRASCQAAWAAALKQCKKTLGDDDYEVMERFQDADELREELCRLEERYNEEPTARLLRRFRPQLQGLKQFSIILVCCLAPTSISLAFIWGAIGLLLELACQSEKALAETTKMLGGISQSLRLFEVYSEHLDAEPEILEALFNIMVDLVFCSSNAIKHFRKTDIRKATTVLPWQNVCERFDDALEEINNKANHLKQLTEARQAVQLQEKMIQTQAMLEKLTSLRSNYNRSEKDIEVTLPCHSSIPFQRNPNFCGRGTVLSAVTSLLENADERSTIRSVALWGTGGIGKTQVALEYANTQITAGKQIVIWISSEDESNVLRSFDDVAEALNVPGYTRGNSSRQNRKLVLLFLQTTDHDWLIIYDNVEDNNLLQENWPKLGRGSIVVTCRSELLAASPAAHSYEIPFLTPDQGSSLFLRIFAKEHPSLEDVEKAKEISEELGGLPLALELMAKQARLRKKTLKNFLEFYERKRRDLQKAHPRDGRNPYYDKDLQTVWQAALENISEDARAVMVLLCFTAPDAIPQTLFSNCEDTTHVEILQDFGFLDDPDAFEEILLELRDNSLIQVNSETSLISIHRLIQAATWDRADGETRKESFYTMLKLYNCHFPGRNAAGHMYDRHQACKQLVQHVSHFTDRYLEMRDNKLVERVINMSDLLCNAAWYLQEISMFSQEKHLLDAALINCPDKTSMEYATIIDGQGALAVEYAYCDDARRYFEEKLSIVKALPEATPRDLSSAYSALGFVLPGSWRHQDAIAACEKAVSYFRDLDFDDAKAHHPDRLWRNCGRAYYFAGMLKEAEDRLQTSVQWAKDIYGADTRYIGVSEYFIGRVAFTRGDFTQASDHYVTAFGLLVKGNPMGQVVAAVLFQQGRVALALDDVPAALAKFRDAEAICEANSAKGNKGEKARVLWYLAKALERHGELPEAAEARTEAESIRQRLLETGKFVLPDVDTEENAWNTFVGMTYR